ncbi:MAG TPA: hypothetical protein DDZ97_10395 [Deltaproteobacteria bacterium]|nr:hypothetical protein [Deltaproteobacteria bacterium]
MRRLSQGMVNLPKVEPSERMMPKIQLFPFINKLWLESISFIGRVRSFLTSKLQGGLATCLIEEP